MPGQASTAAAQQTRTNPTHARAHVRRDSTMTGLSVEEASTYNHRTMQLERVTTYRTEEQKLALII